MKQFDFKTASYSVSGIGNLTMSDAMKLWKTRFPSFEHFRKAVIKVDALKDFGAFVEEMWDSIVPITIQEAFSERNAERRRVYFDCIGVEKIFKNLNPKSLDKQVIKKKRHRWDEKNEPWTHEFEDEYELFSIDPKELYATSDLSDWQKQRQATKYVAVRCKCTSTQREYWIYVPEEEAICNGARVWDDDKKKRYDAIKAIAWTIRIDITNPERVYRQGDIIVAMESGNSKKVTPYHLNKEQYLSLVYSET